MARLHQVATDTACDRYPQVFCAAAHVLPDALRVASFGCASGEECWTLRKYFPRAEIVGIDANLEVLDRARLANTDPGIGFVSADEFGHNEVEFDVVFAMSVFCRWPETKGQSCCAGIYPFAWFAEEIATLAATIRDGGLLVLYNCSFLFGETDTARQFLPVRHPAVCDTGFVSRFDRFHRRIHFEDRSCLFLKRPHRPGPPNLG